MGIIKGNVISKKRHRVVKQISPQTRAAARTDNGAVPDVEAVFSFSVKIEVLKCLLYLLPALRRHILAAGVQPEFENAGRYQKRRPGDGVDPGVGFVYFQMLRPDAINQPLPECFA